MYINKFKCKTQIYKDYKIKRNRKIIFYSKNYINNLLLLFYNLKKLIECFKDICYKSQKINKLLTTVIINTNNF